MKKMITFLLTLTIMIFTISEVDAQCLTFSDGPYTNLNTAGGAPCNDGTTCTPTQVTTFEAWASEAYLLSGVQAGYDYTFDICTGPGAGSWNPTLTILTPTGTQVVGRTFYNLPATSGTQASIIDGIVSTTSIDEAAALTGETAAHSSGAKYFKDANGAFSKVTQIGTEYLFTITA